MRQFYTYIHCKPDLTPFYVGKGTGNRSHNFNKRTNHHKNIVAKYGAENIQVIVFKKDSEESAFASEIRMIKMLRTAGFKLVNLTDGGEGSSNPAEEIRAKLRGNKSRTGMKDSAKRIEEKSIFMMGNKNRLGHVHSEEAKQKISNSLKGNKFSAGHSPSTEHRLKISASLSGRKVSQETREKMSSARTQFWANKQAADKEI